jgi:hypothetical protein
MRSINQIWLRFPYGCTFLRPHYLQPHPYHATATTDHSGLVFPDMF